MDQGNFIFATGCVLNSFMLFKSTRRTKIKRAETVPSRILYLTVFSVNSTDSIAVQMMAGDRSS